MRDCGVGGVECEGSLFPTNLEAGMPALFIISIIIDPAFEALCKQE